jgi:hypothetical protein
LDIRLDAPVPGRFFSTDFPLVEGSQLVELRLPLSRGKAEWKYLFPIRGEYRVAVDVITTEGRQVSRTFALPVREHKTKWYLLGLFTLGLFAVGIMAGRIFTHGSSGGKKKLAVFLLLAISCFASPMALAAQESGTEGYFGWLEIDPPTVGKPAHVHWRLKGEGSAEAGVALLTMTITHLEKGKAVFAVERLRVAGEFSLKFHFPDGADYRVIAIADLPGRQSVRAERHVSVTAVEPPVTAMFPAVTFFLAVVAVGLGVGRWSKKPNWSKSPSDPPF